MASAETIASFVTTSVTVGTQQQAIAGMNFERVGFDVDAELTPADDVPDDMAERVPGQIFKRSQFGPTAPSPLG